MKNRLHLDLRPDDRDAEVARLEALGADRVDIGQGGDESWVVMADPEGNEFCVSVRMLAPACTRATSGFATVGDGLQRALTLQVAEAEPPGQHRDPEGHGAEEQGRLHGGAAVETGSGQPGGESCLDGADSARCRRRRPHGTGGEVHEADRRELPGLRRTPRPLRRGLPRRRG